MPAQWRWFILATLSVAFLAVGMHQAGRDAPTVDEGVDLSSGVNSLVHHDLRIVPEHPPLAKALAAAPALLAHPIVPDTAAYREGRWFDWSAEFIAANEDAGRLRPMLLRARAVVLVEAIGCAALIYVLARRFFGPDGGLLAAAAWLSTPYVVGLSHFAMIDVPFTLATLATAVVLARWLDEPSLGRAVGLGLVLGAAMATRHTALVLIVLSLVTMLWHRRQEIRPAVQQAAGAGLVAVIVVWLVYRGLAPSAPSGAVAARFDGIQGSAGKASVVARLATALPLPSEWRAGFGYLTLTSAARPSSLLGSSWDGGRWWYFPVSALVKIPLTMVLAVVAGWVLAARRGTDRRMLLAVVVVPAVALWVFLVAQPLNLGLRLAMPVVALALVGVGSLARFLAPAGNGHRFRVGAGALALVVVVQLVSSVAAAPHSLAWTPVPFRPAFRWASDANLDAGQALYELRDWSEGRRPYVAFDSTRGLAVGGGSRDLRDVEPAEVRGWVAVGVTPLMQTRRTELAWLRKYCPVGTLGGGSVLLYRFSSAPDPAPGPERPAPPCGRSERSRVIAA